MVYIMKNRKSRTPASYKSSTRLVNVFSQSWMRKIVWVDLLKLLILTRAKYHVRYSITFIIKWVPIGNVKFSIKICSFILLETMNQNVTIWKIKCDWKNYEFNLIITSNSTLKWTKIHTKFLRLKSTKNMI